MMLRTAQIADIPQLLPLIGKICALHQAWDPAKYGFCHQPEQRYESWLGKLVANPRHLCLVVEDQTQLISFLIATVEKEIPLYQLSEFAFVHDLWVEAAYRQRGVARQLVERTIAHFTDLGIAQIRLDTAIANESARALFLDCGFRPSTVELLIELAPPLLPKNATAPDNR